MSQHLMESVFDSVEMHNTDGLSADAQRSALLRVLIGAYPSRSLIECKASSKAQLLWCASQFWESVSMAGLQLSGENNLAPKQPYMTSRPENP